jgi:hypothetical protein
MGFNLHTKDQLLEAWKQGMEEVACQRFHAQVAKALFYTKKENDVITKNSNIRQKLVLKIICTNRCSRGRIHGRLG